MQDVEDSRHTLEEARALRTVMHGLLKRSGEFGAPWQIPDVERATRYIHRRATLREGFRALAAAPIGGERDLLELAATRSSKPSPPMTVYGWPGRRDRT